MADQKPTFPLLQAVPHSGGHYITDQADQTRLGEVHYHPTKDIASRLIACWNALDGIVDPADFVATAKLFPTHESALKEAAAASDRQATEYRMQLTEVSNQRDELLDALDSLLEFLTPQMAEHAGIQQSRAYAQEVLNRHKQDNETEPNS